MLEIEQLEKEWRRYKIRKARPYAVALVLAVTAATLYLVLPRHSIQDTPAEPVAKQQTQTPKMQARPVVTPTGQTEASPVAASAPAAPKPAPEPKKIVMAKASPAPREEKEVILSPDTAFLSSFQTPSTRQVPPPVHEEVIQTKRQTKNVTAKRRSSRTERTAESFQKKKKEATPGRAKSDSSVTTARQKENAPEDSGKLVISTKQTNNTLEYLIERFNQTRDPKLASYIAQSFYKKGNYKETVRWAILANSIDPSGEESWMLFAKAKVKLGHREDAIKALRIYLNQYSSRKVKSYLQSLETGL